MEPVLREGDWLLVLPARHARPGEVVVVRDPAREGALLVKRVRSVDGEGFTVSGEGEHGEHLADRGRLEPGRLVGRAVWRYAPLRRFGPVR